MSPYKHIFFDLDRTLWDMDGNSHETLCELAHKHNIIGKGVSTIDEFIEHYKVINHQLWADYSLDKISKETLRSERFIKAFGIFNIVDDEFCETFAMDYVTNGPLKNNLLPYAIETLDYLVEKYQLHIITNGFEEVQLVKIEKSNLGRYFKNIITSEKAGHKKPSPEIFNFSMQLADAKVGNSIMIGDSLEADIMGAKSSGIAQVFFNPEKILHEVDVTHEIYSLKELKNIL